LEGISLGGRQQLHDLPQTWRVIKRACDASDNAVVDTAAAGL